MQVYEGRAQIDRFEHLVDTATQTVTHLQVRAGEDIGRHRVDRSVVVVIYRGCVVFATDEEERELRPGMVVTMQPNEFHSLRAVQDSDLVVVKSVLADSI